MRLLTTFEDRFKAENLSNYLTTQDIPNNLDDESEKEWSIWIHDEDHIDSAKTILDDFSANPEDAKFLKAKIKASHIKHKVEKENRHFNKKIKDGRTLFHKQRSFTSGPVVLFFLFVCVSVFFIQMQSEDRFLEKLGMASFGSEGLSDIFQKFQIWRLVTPAIMHDSILHLVFNCYWLFYLGSMIEDRWGSRNLIFLILGVAVFSNFTQYIMAGPGFYGFSGVNYGMFGLVWVMSRHDPLSGFVMHHTTVYWMMGFLMLGILGIFPHVANGAHVGGLIAGAGIGFIRARFFPS